MHNEQHKSNRMEFTMKNTHNLWLNSTWGSLIGNLLSTANRLFIGLFGTLMLPLLILPSIGYITAFIVAPPCDIDGIREPVAGSLLYGNNMITGALIPSSNAIGVHFYPIWWSLGFDQWLYSKIMVVHINLSIYYPPFYWWCHILDGQRMGIQL